MGLQKAFSSQAASSIKLGSLPALPSTEDLLFVLATATKNKKTAELPFKNPYNNIHFIIKVAPATMQYAPRWTFVRCAPEGDVVLWTQNSKEVIMIQGKIKIQANYSAAMYETPVDVDAQAMSSNQAILTGYQQGEYPYDQATAGELAPGTAADGYQQDAKDSGTNYQDSNRSDVDSDLNSDSNVDVDSDAYGYAQSADSGAYTEAGQRLEEGNEAGWHPVSNQESAWQASDDHDAPWQNEASHDAAWKKAGDDEDRAQRQSQEEIPKQKTADGKHYLQTRYGTLWEYETAHEKAWYQTSDQGSLTQPLDQEEPASPAEEAHEEAWKIATSQRSDVTAEGQSQGQSQEQSQEHSQSAGTAESYSERPTVEDLELSEENRKLAEKQKSKRDKAWQQAADSETAWLNAGEHEKAWQKVARDQAQSEEEAVRTAKGKGAAGKAGHGKSKKHGGKKATVEEDIAPIKDQPPAKNTAEAVPGHLAQDLSAEAQRQSPPHPGKNDDATAFRSPVKVPPPVKLHPEVLDTYLASLSDPATGLLSHGAFEFFLLRDAEYVSRRGGEMSLIVFDFINPATNQPPSISTEAAKIVAGIMAESCGPLELCTQLRSGEFAMLLCGYDGVDALAFAERLCGKLPSERTELSILADLRSLAMGVACIPETCKDPGSLISAAIKAKNIARQSERLCMLFPQF